MLVNEGLPLYVCDQLQRMCDLGETKIGLLGMSFKSENDDTRSSLSYKLKKILQFKAKEVLTTDPYVTTDQSILPLHHVLQESDILILCVPHKIYKEIDLGDKPLVDIWYHRTKQPFPNLQKINAAAPVGN